MGKFIRRAWTLPGLLAAFLLAGCFGNDPVGDAPLEEAVLEGTWIQTRVEFHTKTAQGLSPLPITYRIVDGDTVRSHFIHMDTALPSEFWQRSVVRIGEGRITWQGPFVFWLLNLEGEFIKPDSMVFIKLGGSRRLMNGSDTVSCTRIGTELGLRFTGIFNLPDSIVTTAYYKPYDGVFPHPVPDFGGLEPWPELSPGDTTLDSVISQKLRDLQNGVADLDSLLNSFRPDSGS